MQEALKLSVRVTLEMGDQPRPHRIEGGPLGRGIDTLAGSVVLPSDPRAKSGVYWGYTVRIASGLSAVFSECPYEVHCMALLPSSFTVREEVCVCVDCCPHIMLIMQSAHRAAVKKLHVAQHRL